MSLDAKGTRLRRAENPRLCLLSQLLLALRHALREIGFHDAGLFRLGENAASGGLFFPHVVFDLVRQHLNLGIKVFILRRSGHDLDDQGLGAVMLDLGFFKHPVFHVTTAGGIKDLLLEQRVD